LLNIRYAATDIIIANNTIRTYDQLTLDVADLKRDIIDAPESDIDLLPRAENIIYNYRRIN
jgi:hypothetical protein